MRRDGPFHHLDRDLRFHRLDPDEIIATATTLSQRIEERFPGSGLAAVCRELIGAARKATVTVDWLARPHYLLRITAGVIIAIMVAGIVLILSQLKLRLTIEALSELLQALDAGVNNVVFFVVAVFFLSNWETRRKRALALRSLHTLRSLAHIVDMHQLTKDPDRIVPGPDTPSSPDRPMTAFELTRYLDYCSEMLSLIAKVAALHVQQFDDPATITAVTDMENLTSGLSRKIWQKIMLLDRIVVPPGDHAG